jgi:hypothetical protein
VHKEFLIFYSQSSVNPVASAAYPASFFIRPFTVMMLAAEILETGAQSP